MKHIKRKSYYYLEYWELEKLAREIYGKEYCFISSQEANNDSCYIISTADTDEVDEEEFQEWIDNDINLFPRTLLTKLCADGHIPYGSYLINVCW